MKKIILFLGSITASLAIISIPILLVYSISWCFEAIALFTILTTIEFIILVDVVYELAKTEEEYMKDE